MLTVQRDGSQGLGKDSLGVKAGKIGESLHLKGAEKEFTILNFLMSVHSEKSKGQEETCLKFNRIERNIKVLLVLQRHHFAQLN